MGYKPKQSYCPTCGHVLDPSHAKALKDEGQPKHLAVQGVVKKTSEKALLISADGRDVWVPRSQVKDGHTLTEGSTNPHVVAWFVKREDLPHA